MGEPCEREIHLGEAVRGAPGVFSGTGFVELETGRMMGVVRGKDGDENGGIEKKWQLESSETAQIAL